MKHLIKRGNIYYYRKRIPTAIQHLSTVREIHRPLSSDLKSAKRLLRQYEHLFTMIDLALKLRHSIDNLVKELQLPTVKQKSIYDVFLESKRDVAATSYREYRQQLELFKVLLPTSLDKLSYKHIDTVKEVLNKLPKRNIQKYRDMSLRQVIKSTPTEDERLSVKSRNEYLKTLRALLKLAKQRNYLSTEFTIDLFKNKVSTRSQRDTLNTDEKNLLFNDSRVGSMAKICYYSGMRLSEVYKCSIKLVDDVLCFDLTDRSISLKTDSSYRVVPVHEDILNDIEVLMDDARSVTDKVISRRASKLLNTKGKTLYSLRHSFATELAARGIETGVISELLGHTQKGMTLSRYVKGYPVQLLSRSISVLESV